MARPKEFEPQEALEKAMHQFWAKGYHDTSIRDLVERTGVNYYGLYGEFENKHGLFLAALEQYRKTITAEFIRELNKPGAPIPVIQHAFERLVRMMRTPDGAVGCMMCNTAIELAPYDTDAAARVQDHMKALRGAFRSRLSKAQAEGTLSKDKDIAALAEFLTSTAYSLGTLLRAGCNNAQVRRHIHTVVSTLE